MADVHAKWGPTFDLAALEENYVEPCRKRAGDPNAPLGLTECVLAATDGGKNGKGMIKSVGGHLHGPDPLGARNLLHE